MQAYWPDSSSIALRVAAILAATLFLGAVLNARGDRPAARFLAWLLAIAGLAATLAACRGAPAGFRSLALIASGLYAMKAVVAVEARRKGMPALAPGRWLAYAAFWFGMRPQLFAGERRPDRGEARRLAARGFPRLAQGLALVWLAGFLWQRTGSRLLATAVLLVGLSLALHFGIMNLMAGLWQRVGFRTEELFLAPLRAESLTEFWGRRWNLAFNQMAAAAVYAPLWPELGRRGAMVTAFLFSGLLHEMAISLPVDAGYGLPLGYFVLHAGAMLFERRRLTRHRPMRGLRGWLWTILWLALPLPMLFHLPFLREVVWPLAGIR